MRKKRKSLHKQDLSSKRRSKKKNKLIFYLVIMALLAGGVVGLTRLSALQIKEVKVSKTNRVNAAALSQIARKQIAGTYLGIFPRSNLIIYPKSEIEKLILESQPAILSADVGTDFKHALTIGIKERLIEALWCKSPSNCYAMDESGTIFANDSAGASSGDMVKYYGMVTGDPLGRQYGEASFYPNLKEFVGKMQSLGLKAVSVNVIDANNAKMFFADGSYLQFLPNEKDKLALFENISLFVSDLRAKNGGILTPFEYIDARYGNKIFYKTKQVENETHD